ncbi:MAG TPA: gamma-glutamyl-gamma-aminobutyrate hydrolase family protein [Acetobacteraceae bacterium]|nr:gamma-glutamyl-gamma-aminobutyrate hydrolase family protein [Acetobacteraceae bacterium]
MTLIVGVPACSKTVNGEPQHSTPTRYGAALMGAAGAIPVLLPPVGEAMLEVLDRLDGLLLSGSPSNVHPELYGSTKSLTPGKHDRFRDETTLPLAREALRRGMPVLAICRGIQELNVAMGGTLHQQVHLVEGCLDHRAGTGTLEHMFRMKHTVRVSGQLARIIGAQTVMVNSLHEQGIDRVADGLEVEAVAEDGTIEAVRVRDAKGFAFGVQFHPEWHWATDAASRAIFEAFGEACRRYRAERDGAAVRRVA